MRKIQEYRLKGKDIFIGLEVSKRTWKLCVRGGKMIVHETGMPAEYENLRGYIRGNYPDCKVEVIYEAGFSGFWLHDFLEQDGYRCVVTPPNKVTQEKVNRVKTDKIDARRLAINLENGDYASCHVPDKGRNEDRQVSRTLDQMQKDIKATKNRIRKFLDYHGLNGDLKAGAWRSMSSYRELRSLTLSGPLGISLDMYLDHLDKLDEIMIELRGQLKEMCEKERYREAVRLKSSLPGVGWLSAIRYTLEWGDLSRFKTGKHFASYIGLTSSEYSTGESRRQGRVTKQSSAQVRSWLIQCAWRAIKIDAALLDKYDRVLKNSGSKNKAIVAVARKLAVRMRAVELSGEPYCLAVIE